MTKTNEGRPLHNASYSTSASAYKLLALSRDSARPLWNAQDNPEEALAAGVVIELRRSIGYPLPLSTAESPRGTHFFVPSTRMHSCIATIMRLDAGNSHTGGILRLPEGRHVLSRSKIREIGACVAASGWTIDDERLFNLVAGLQEGESPREAMLCDLLGSACNLGTSPATADALLQLYDDIVGTETSAKIFSLCDDDGDRCRKTLEAICAAIAPHTPLGSFPVIAALTAYEVIRLLKPFPAVNTFMASFTFSRILIANGYLLTSFIPITALLAAWDDSCVSSNEPAGLDRIMATAQNRDWSLWIEEALSLCTDYVEQTAEKLFDLFASRQLMSKLIAQDEGLNIRQQKILLEALLHEDAEFTFGELMETENVAYATAYSDLSSLKDLGFLVSRTFGKTTVFMAGDALMAHLGERLRSIDAAAWEEVFNDDGTLTDAAKTAHDDMIGKLRTSAPLENEFIGFKSPVFDPSRAVVLRGDALD